MATHEIKRNDTRPYWPVTLRFEDGSSPDLTGGSVRFIAKYRENKVVKIDTAASITGAAAGEVEWRPTASETDTAGRFLCEWEATLADGTIQTFPTRGYDRLTIIGDLA